MKLPKLVSAALIHAFRIGGSKNDWTVSRAGVMHVLAYLWFCFVVVFFFNDATLHHNEM